MEEDEEKKKVKKKAQHNVSHKQEFNAWWQHSAAKYNETLLILSMYIGCSTRILTNCRVTSGIASNLDVELPLTQETVGRVNRAREGVGGAAARE